jgi:threonine dehydrogenase-like Zn-dependent dehydrogenase
MRVAAWRDPGGRRQGAYAEYMPIAAGDVLPVPENLPLSALASLELAMCVQASFDALIERRAVAGSRFAVSGLGPSGLIAVQMARAYGAREVVGIDPISARREQARALGADRVLEAGSDTLPVDRFHDGSLDAALDTTGLKASIHYLMARTKKTVGIFGVLRETLTFGPAQWWGNFALLGYNHHYRAAAQRALALILEGWLDLAPLITHTLPLSRYSEGVELLRKQEAIKILFEPG